MKKYEIRNLALGSFTTGCYWAATLSRLLRSGFDLPFFIGMLASLVLTVVIYDKYDTITK